ncbi:MAG: DUF5688 family protein [Hungatella sp.]|nr:DUF5688 family protein [Hungatella sp.]
MKKNMFTDIKDQIIYVLENSAELKENGNNIPHEDYLDMVKTFYILRGEEGYDFRITWADLERWGVDLKTVSESADRNSPILCPVKIYRIETTLFGLEKIKMGNTVESILENMKHIENIEFPMFVLTNTAELYGASNMLNHQLISQIAERWQDDILLLPSSIDEVLMIPLGKSNKRLEEWQQTVAMMNGSEMLNGKVLSNSVYIYDRNKKKVIVGAAG